MQKQDIEDELSVFRQQWQRELESTPSPHRDSRPPQPPPTEPQPQLTDEEKVSERGAVVPFYKYHEHSSFASNSAALPLSNNNTIVIHNAVSVFSTAAFFLNPWCTKLMRIYDNTIQHALKHNWNTMFVCEGEAAVPVRRGAGAQRQAVRGDPALQARHTDPARRGDAPLRSLRAEG